MMIQYQGTLKYMYFPPVPPYLSLRAQAPSTAEGRATKLWYWNTDFVLHQVTVVL